MMAKNDPNNPSAKKSSATMTPEEFRKEVKELSKLLEKAKKAAEPAKGLNFFKTIFGALFANGDARVRIRSQMEQRGVSVEISVSSLKSPLPNETPGQKSLREQLDKDLPAAFGCKNFDDSCAVKLAGMLQTQVKAVDGPFSEFDRRFAQLKDCLDKPACAEISEADRTALERLKGLDADAIARQMKVLEVLNDNSGKLPEEDAYVCSSKAAATPGSFNLDLCTDAFTFRNRGLPEPAF